MRAELQREFAAWRARLRGLPRPARRRLQRQWKQPLASLALLLTLGSAPALAGIINVRDGCTLVDAVTAANTDTAAGLCAAGSGGDTLVLRPRSTHTLTIVNNSTYGPNGLPVVASAIAIDGNGSTIKRGNGAPNLRIFTVNNTGKLTLREATVSGGVGAGAFPDNVGGGVLNAGGIVGLIDSTLSGNSATAGGGLHNRGGAVTLHRSAVLNNDASYGGGGVDNHAGGTLTITSSTISGNSSSRGGTLNRESSSFTIINSTISGNEGGFFGAVANLSASTLTVNNSTIAGNASDLNGGGISNFDATALVSNSTISGNSAVGSVVSDGGGIASYRSTLTLSDSTITGNATSGTGGGIANGDSVLTLRRTLIAGNTAPVGAELRIASGTISADGFNLFGHSGLTSAQAFANFTLGASDIIATSDGTTPTPLAVILSPTLAENGGPTRTHALASGSPAIDAVISGCPPPEVDQRGAPRPQDGDDDAAASCDIGAFERVRPGTVTCDGLPATKVGTPAGQTLTGTPGADVIHGLGGNDIIRGLGGEDVLCGGSGEDALIGGPGADRLFGGAGRDRLNGEFGFDRCDGGSPAKGDTAAACERLSNVP